MSNSTIYERFAETVTQFPDRPAIIEQTQTLTYAQLDRRIDVIAGNFPSRREGQRPAGRSGASEVPLEGRSTP